MLKFFYAQREPSIQDGGHHDEPHNASNYMALFMSVGLMALRL